MDTVTRTASPAQAPAPLTAQDRCDSCAAQAYVRAVLPSGGDLQFCGHHAGEHRAALIVAGAAFHDETGKLSEKRGSGFAA